MTFTSYNLFMRDLASGGIEYAAHHSKKLGFSGVEFLDLCGTGTPINKEKYPAAEVKKVLSNNGLSVDCYSVYANALYENREFYETEIRRQIDYAAAVGAGIFHHTLMPYLKVSENMPKYGDVFDEVLAREKQIAKYCNERGLECIYEPQGLYFNGVDGLSRLILALREDNANVGFCADLGNAVYVDCDPIDVTDALKSCVRHVHVKDYIVADAPVEGREGARSLGGKYLYEVLPAEGELRLGECLKILKAAGYDGCISLEYACDDETMRKTMAYMERLWNE